MKSLYLLTAFIICSFQIGYSQSGSADTTFGKEKIVITEFGLTDNPYQVTNKGLLLASDSSIYLILEGNGFTCIAKRLSNGAIDLQYGFDGFSIPASITNATAALDTAGNIIIVGGGQFFYGTSVVIKYNKDGTVTNQFPIAPYDFTPSSFAIQEDGKIVIACYDSQLQYYILRYNPDGTRDNTFSKDGQTHSDFGSISAISLQPGNKLVVAGQYCLMSNQPGSDFAVGRYNADGSIDSSFGIEGKQTTTFGFRSVATSLALRNDGRIVAAGFSYNNYNSDIKYVLACYTTGGSLDRTFSSDGKIILSSSVSSIAVQKNNKIITVGFAVDNFEITRYNKNGTLDNTFGGNGKQTTDFEGSDIANAIAVRSDGKIVAAGNNRSGYYDKGDFFEVARYNASGSLDNTFDNDGKLKDSLQEYMTYFNL